MKIIEALISLESRQTLFVAFLLAIIAHLADVVSSLVCTLVGNCYESNTLVQNTFGYFSPFPGIELKLVYFLLWLLPLSYFIYRFTRSYLLASLPLFYVAYTTWYVVISNICVLLAGASH